MPSPAKQTHKETPPNLVWDLYIRVFHWGLVLAISTTALSGFVLGATWLQLHIWSGVTAGILVLTRLIWGFFGSTHARFSDFVKGPASLIRHIREMRAGDPGAHIGHNPLGGLMILALIAVIAALVLSGALVLGGVFKTGPLAFALHYATGVKIAQVHEILAIGLLVLVGLHIAGAIGESLRQKENLPLAMITGRKRTQTVDQSFLHNRAQPLLAITLGAVLLGGLVWGGLGLAAKPGIGMPVANIDPLYGDECSACHMAYHPSLIRAENWRALMAGLSDHFGEDASLGQKATAEIEAWLTAHSAETADSKPAHVLTPDPAAPFTPSKSPFWIDQHAAIPKERFTTKPVFSKANCAACHSDAEAGRFYPANISIPKEPKL